MEILKPYRQRIDALDDQIVDLLVARIRIIEEVAALKSENGIPAILQDRIDEVCERNASRAQDQGLAPELVRGLYADLIDWCCAHEERIMTDKKKSA